MSDEPTSAASSTIAVASRDEALSQDPVEEEEDEETLEEGDTDKDNKPDTETEDSSEEKRAPSASAPPVVSSSKKSRPPYKYDPDKITLRFLFANRDGLTVTIECQPADTVGEVKGALLSVWPEDLPDCSGGDRLRLICMGKGYLMPDTRTLEDCQIPKFKTHPTPINVSIRPEVKTTEEVKKKSETAAANRVTMPTQAMTTSQGCGCVIQ